MIRSLNSATMATGPPGLGSTRPCDDEDETLSNSSGREPTCSDCSISGTDNSSCVTLRATTNLRAREARSSAPQQPHQTRNRLSDAPPPPTRQNRRPNQHKRRPSSTLEDETHYGDASDNKNTNSNNKRKLLRRGSRRSFKENQPDQNTKCSEGPVILSGDSDDRRSSYFGKRRSCKSSHAKDYQTHCCLFLTSALRETVSCERTCGGSPHTAGLPTQLQETNTQNQFCPCGCYPPVLIQQDFNFLPGILTCPIRNAMATAGTNAAQSFSSLFEDERLSDVVLLVGAEGTQERIPAHSWVLGHNNDYFRSLLTGHLRDPTVREFYFNEDQPRGFRNLVRWLYGCGCAPAGTQSALDTLQVAIKYLAIDLVEHVVDYLSKNLQPDNVLQIMAWGHQYSSNSSLAPSAPPADDVQTQEDLPPPYPGTAPPPPYDAIYNSDPTSSCQVLVSECFSLLDVKADQVLASESLEEVSAPLLAAVLSRNSLGVSSEGPVLDALHRWSSAECRRQHRPLTLEGRRGVLGQMLTLPRLLTISVSQLTVLEKLYEQNEISYITARVKGDPSSSLPGAGPPPPAIFVGFLEQLAKKRVPPTEQNIKNKKNKQKNSNKKKYSTKQFFWDVFSAFAHMID